MIQNLIFFSSPFFVLFLLLILEILKKYKIKINLFKVYCAYLLVFFLIYSLLTKNSEFLKWHDRLLNPLFSVLSVLVIPAIILRKTRYHVIFLFISVAAVLFDAGYVLFQYMWLDRNSGFIWFPIPPGYLMTGISGLLIIAEHFLSLNSFRKLTRIIMLIILLYGGFAFRKNHIDYNNMLSRRAHYQEKVLNLSETVPVMESDNRFYYIPSAPCRFSADGGYVQGCIMELLERSMQLDYAKEKVLLGMVLAAILSTMILCFIGARWWCGWVCPLSTLGDLFDFVRRFIRLPHLKLNGITRRAAFAGGLSFATIGLSLARAYAYIDENGKFMGCKIPLYPFCKICPGQQVCPVASQGLNAYAGLPGFEWLFGFFKISTILLLGIFLFGFMTSRRLWCRFCPMGMAGGIFNRGGMISLVKNPVKCNGCGVCNEVCPMDIYSVQKEMNKTDVSHFDCVYCLKCVASCPKEGCLKFEFAGETITESKYGQPI